VRAWLASGRLPAAIGHRREGEDRGEVKREWRREREDANYGCICVDIGLSVSRSRGGDLISARPSVFSVRQASALITRSLRRTCRSSACPFDRRVHACVRASERAIRGCLMGVWERTAAARNEPGTRTPSRAARGVVGDLRRTSAASERERECAREREGRGRGRGRERERARGREGGREGGREDVVGGARV